MTSTYRMKSLNIVATALALVMSLSAAGAEDVKLMLSGDQEVPAVVTSAKGSGTITVAADKSVSGSVTTTQIEGVAAHIHLGAPGKNGPPVITLTQTATGVWSVPAAAKLSDEQYASYKAGGLYVNVHSAAHKAGEIRAQLKP